MKIILTKNFNNLGEKGDTVHVKNGYAKNYLFPSQKAMLATPKNIQKVNLKKKINDINKKINDISKINDTTIIIAATTKNENEIYGSINPQTLSKILKKLNIKINLKNINKNISIKKIGRYKLELKNKKQDITSTIYIILSKTNK